MFVGDALLVLPWALATVFFFAGLGKVLSGGSVPDTSLALGEISLAILLVSRVLPIAVAVLACGVTIVYGIYAFIRRNEEPCRCFGSHLPATRSAGQRVRNGLLALLAMSYLAASMAALPRATVLVGDAVGGFLVGAAIVLGPWLFQWAAGPVEAMD